MTLVVLESDWSRSRIRKPAAGRVRGASRLELQIQFSASSCSCTILYSTLNCLQFPMPRRSQRLKLQKYPYREKLHHCLSATSRTWAQHSLALLWVTGFLTLIPGSLSCFRKCILSAFGSVICQLPAFILTEAHLGSRYYHSGMTLTPKLRDVTA